MIGIIIAIFIVALIAVGGITGKIPGLDNVQDYAQQELNTLQSADEGGIKGIALSRDIARKTDSNVIQTALLQYRIENALYPQQLSALVPDYLPEIPSDPKTKEPYQYTMKNKGESFELCLTYETGQNAGVSCISPH